jgi:hypothetical protein
MPPKPSRTTASPPNRVLASLNYSDMALVALGEFPSRPPDPYPLDGT